MPDTPTRDSSVRKAVGIKAFGLPGLQSLISELGQPRYRATQVARWLYARSVSTFEEMSDIPATLRSELAARFGLPRLELVSRVESRIDGTRKYLWRLADGVMIEGVGLPAGDRLTVCFSTQAGCAMGCAFCATGAGGLTRNLFPGEMVDQVAFVRDDFHRRVTNAVAMGQGEPFANYDAVLEGVRVMNSSDGLGIGARHITISTCGVLPGIARLATEPEQFTLAVSLHSAIQRTRDALMPGVRKWPLSELRSALVAYVATSGRRPSLEYALIESVNDGAEDLAALVAFCSGLSVHVNLIPMNPVDSASFSRSDAGRAAQFVRSLTRAGIESSVRVERGADIDAACGQLRQRVIASEE